MSCLFLFFPSPEAVSVGTTITYQRASPVTPLPALWPITILMCFGCLLKAVVCVWVNVSPAPQDTAFAEYWIEQSSSRRVSGSSSLCLMDQGPGLKVWIEALGCSAREIFLWRVCLGFHDKTIQADIAVLGFVESKWTCGWVDLRCWDVPWTPSSQQPERCWSTPKFKSQFSLTDSGQPFLYVLWEAHIWFCRFSSGLPFSS